ncbi:F-box protein At4g00755 isoform X2 [Nicotiana tabacum]|uniref:F-box protein At4g00755 isoform X2 n=1 Tax=Nicotiana tabacum TaxID=4097 RepID=A0AC58TAU7_TOBAC
METLVDFVQWLEIDVSLNILMRLNDPADVVRAGSVSHLWLQFVVANGLSKQLCLRKFPQLSRISRIREPDLGIAEGKDVKFSNSTWETLKRDHNVYASLLQAIETSNSCPSDCIDYEVSASSTDDYPVSVWNTLVPTDRNQDQPSYWSSTGDSDPNAPETLIYKLKADLCVITEINIQPLEVYSHPGRAICCPKSVRFRLGHPKSSRDKRRLLHWHPDQPADDKFIWTYTSEEFLMRQVRLLTLLFPKRRRSYLLEIVFLFVGGVISTGGGTNKLVLKAQSLVLSRWNSSPLMGSTSRHYSGQGF